ncbi:hypothetical protein [Phycisphaera mikurensis]|nr:hypothetical protein [Phycisphaera mikurensis]MBB6441275.1 hypothetical protein [Phycisphaera mikurensis]
MIGAQDSKPESGDWNWERQPAAATLLAGWLEAAQAANPWLRDFAERLHAESGNRLADLVDLWSRPDTPDARLAIERAGYRPLEAAAGGHLFHHPRGMFPRVLLHPRAGVAVDLRVESCADFGSAHGLSAAIEGVPGAPLRRLAVYTAGGVAVRAARRRGSLAAVITGGPCEPTLTDQALVLESFRGRPRRFADEAAGFDELAERVDAAVARVGRDVACSLFFAAERDFWERRNAAARWQASRQAALGIGWANHDHHTYRSSRVHFHRLVALFEKLGFHCRERFSPGAAAGWGAQVMEQPVCGIVTFNDVDLSPAELRTDFAHTPLGERDTLATVGLWCGLHGESILQAGMHHLECTFDFGELREQMASGGIETMRPFTDFDHLKQAFTRGELWQVEEGRLNRLVDAGRISGAEAEAFRRDGAIGSHLENLERNEGFKGFNQRGVTEVIHATDPRRQPSSPA